VDVGDFAEPRKILCQCALPSVKKDQNTPGPRMGQPEFPNSNLIASIVSAIYHNIEEPYLSMDSFKERAFVTPKNIIVSEINDSYTSTDNRSSQRQPQESLQQQTNIMQQPEDPVASR